ncbi:TonB-dependent receptor [Telluria mixta]|uniref:TonB-dependent receptor n=1 Tax=Telluria mixta TaxID=34071 RepID=A0ABT2C1F5_9BURK|nr:TonB-dependent receptor [Telluria mixta]MCS0631212.1 TonB-dependent receptor [Telluria mixta]WEM95751.1 TonB-dependent receptor [Telluria mixta]
MKYLIASTSIGVLAAANTVYAQESNETANADAPKQAITEVIVTAQKRSTSIQKTPVSMEVYKGDDLVTRGVTDIVALGNTDTSVNIQMNTGVPVVAVRGVSSSNTSETGDPSVSIATDGIFLNRNYAAFAGFYDIERVEILRGPQGTLFGRNSTGGTLNIITRKPEIGENNGRLTSEFGSFNQRNFDGFANLSFSDNAAMRASFSSRHHDGYRKASDMPLRGDDEDAQSTRLQFLFEPTKRVSLWFAAESTKLGGNGSVSENLPFVYPTTGGNEPLHSFSASQSSDGKRFAFGGFPKLNATIKDYKWSATVSDIFPNVTLTYVGGYNSTDYNRQLNVFNNMNTRTMTFIQREHPNTVNQELRLSSDAKSPLVWQVGAYYFKEKSKVYTNEFWDYLASNQTELLLFDFPQVDSSSTALFGQVSYDLTQQLKLSVGARETKDKKVRTGIFSLFGPYTGAPFTINIPQDGRSDSKKATWAVDLDYQMTRSSLLYAKVSTGYKAGGFSGTETYGPETVIAYELGSKNRFLDNRVQLNLAAYKMDYKDQQVSQFVSGVTSSGIQTVNAGRSELYGLESSLLANLDYGRVNLSANYLHARYKSFVTTAGYDSTVNLNLSGNKVPLAPALSLSAQYEYDIADVLGGMLTPRARVKHESEKYFAPTNFANQRQGGYTTLDLNLDFKPGKANWLLQFYVNNATDKKIFTQADESYLNADYTYTYAPPRTYGARLTVDF